MQEQTDEEEQWSEDALIQVDGKPFRCECGCNVFRKLLNSKDGKLHYKCNGCQLTYTGEK